MLDDESVDSALERINAWEAAMVERAERADALALRASTLSATARSRDGLVEVTVGAEGQLSQLSLDERTRQQPAEMTARTVVETLQAAKPAGPALRAGDG
jgi:DNA-binding protein YbaB